jgi:hypothetical protein
MNPERGVCLAALTLTAAIASAQTVELDELQGLDTKEGDFFGSAVDLGEDRLLAGAELAEAAYVFERQPDGAWAEVAKLSASDGAPSACFGAAVALDGDRALIGAPDAGLGGAAYVFERGAGGAWTEVAKLVPSSGGAGDFGDTVALSGDRALVGDSSNSDLGKFSGAAHLFERGPGGAWSEAAVLHGTELNPIEAFGREVELDGDRALVSAVWSALVYVFERQPGGAWSVVEQIGPLPAFNGHLALDGDRALASRSTAVDVYERQPDGQWSLVATLTEPGLSPTACALDGERAVVGGFLASTQGLYSGSVLVFAHEGLGAWSRANAVVPATASASDWFGFSVAIRGDRVAGGGPQDHSPLFGAGSVNLFDLSPLNGSPSAISLSAGGAQAFALDAGKYYHGGEIYVLLGSLSGTAPGVVGLGGVVLPLNDDAYFQHTLGHPNEFPLSGSLGTLSLAGSGSAVFALPAGLFPTLAGLTVHHAFATVNFAVGSLTLASNAVALELVP